MAKLLENPEERKRRRLEKKAKKMKNRQANETVAGYTNEANPFGDGSLSEKFVWNKKIQKDSDTGIRQKRLSKQEENDRRDEVGREIEKVRKRREEREAEKEAWEAEKERMQRECDGFEYGEYKVAEDQFHLKQQRERALIRIREGRAKPIDRIMNNLSTVGKDEFDIECPEPYAIFVGCSTSDVEDIRTDIKTNLEFDKLNQDFWQCMMLICDDEFQNQKMGDASRLQGDGLHSSIDADIERVLRGKSASELDGMESSIESKINSGDSVDVEYWEALLRKLKVQKAKAKLRDTHAGLLRSHLNALENAEAKDFFGRDHEMRANEDAATMEDGWDGDAETLFQSNQESDNAAGEDGAVPDAESTARDDFSPELFDEDEIEENAEVVDENVVQEELEAKRREVLNEQQRKQDVLRQPNEMREEDQADLMFKRESAKSLREGEEAFNNSIELSQTYWWHDKYRPRKPRYFNRVHTGYDWNKYNQTHYDHDNPPPKVVQGYKFNMFYPDLIDRNCTPSYSLHPVDGNPDMVQIRFKAGPPYEDIAFHIVNKEWEYSFKRGFKCTFERGILHLYFNFNRSRYRR